jgi:hypothetical protein
MAGRQHDHLSLAEGDMNKFKEDALKAPDGESTVPTSDFFARAKPVRREFWPLTIRPQGRHPATTLRSCSKPSVIPLTKFDGSDDDGQRIRREQRPNRLRLKSTAATLMNKKRTKQRNNPLRTLQQFGAGVSGRAAVIDRPSPTRCHGRGRVLAERLSKQRRTGLAGPGCPRRSRIFIDSGAMPSFVHQRRGLVKRSNRRLGAASADGKINSRAMPTNNRNAELHSTFTGKKPARPHQSILSHLEGSLSSGQASQYSPSQRHDKDGREHFGLPPAQKPRPARG